MRFRNIFWGLILIILGLLFTLENLNVIDFDWYNLWRLWPVILVLWGVSILPVKNLVKTILVVLVLGGSIYYMLDNTVRWESENSYTFDFSDDNSYDDVDQDFTIPMNDSIKMAKLDMEVAASSFHLTEESTGLADFVKSGNQIEYKYTVMQRDSIVDLDIFMEDDFEVNHRKSNTIDLGLNKAPVWDMYFDVGAAKAELDLSNLKIRKLDIDGGAASIIVKVGDNYDITKIKIETGASSIKIKVPEESGCELKISAVLSGKNISGFEKLDHGYYRTSNYDSASNHINIDIETAVSSYSIERY